MNIQISKYLNIWFGESPQHDVEKEERKLLTCFFGETNMANVFTSTKGLNYDSKLLVEIIQNLVGEEKKQWSEWMCKWVILLMSDTARYFPDTLEIPTMQILSIIS